MQLALDAETAAALSRHVRRAHRKEILTAPSGAFPIW